MKCKLCKRKLPSRNVVQMELQHQGKFISVLRKFAVHKHCRDKELDRQQFEEIKAKIAEAAGHKKKPNFQIWDDLIKKEDINDQIDAFNYAFNAATFDYLYKANFTGELATILQANKTSEASTSIKGTRGAVWWMDETSP